MIPAFLLEQENHRTPPNSKGRNLSFLDRTMKRAAHFVTSTFQLWKTSNQEGYFQKLDGRVKILFMLVFIVLINWLSSVSLQLIITTTILISSLISNIATGRLYEKASFLAFIFGFIIFVPSSLNLFTKGENLLTLVTFDTPKYFWIYTIPDHIYITKQGMILVTRLTLKVLNSVSLVLLIISTTNFERIIKSLSSLGIPSIFLLTLSLTYKFIFILSLTVIETYQALKMRWWTKGSVMDSENIVAGRIAYLFRKSWERYELSYQAMLVRGYQGKVVIYYQNRLNFHDYIFTGIAGLLFCTIIVIQLNYAPSF